MELLRIKKDNLFSSRQMITERVFQKEARSKNPEYSLVSRIQAAKKASNDFRAILAAKMDEVHALAF